MLNYIAIVILISSIIGIKIIIYRKIPLLIKLPIENKKNDIKDITSKNQKENFSDNYWKKIKEKNTFPKNEK